jgi:hypothetical protein
MPIIEGIENIENGNYFLKRYSFIKGIKTETVRYKIIKNNKNIIIKDVDNNDISDKLRRIEIKKNNEVLMWINPSRLGLMFNIE